MLVFSCVSQSRSLSSLYLSFSIFLPSERLAQRIETSSYLQPGDDLRSLSGVPKVPTLLFCFFELCYYQFTSFFSFLSASVRLNSHDLVQFSIIFYPMLKPLRLVKGLWVDPKRFDPEIGAYLNWLFFHEGILVLLLLFLLVWTEMVRQSRY